VFTGIVEEIGLVKEIIPGNKSIKLTIKCEKIMDDVKSGQHSRKRNLSYGHVS